MYALLQLFNILAEKIGQLSRPVYLFILVGFVLVFLSYLFMGRQVKEVGRRMKGDLGAVYDGKPIFDWKTIFGEKTTLGHTLEHIGYVGDVARHKVLDLVEYIGNVDLKNVRK
jgi:hypothetical protein